MSASPLAPVRGHARLYVRFIRYVNQNICRAAAGLLAMQAQLLATFPHFSNQANPASYCAASVTASESKRSNSRL